MYRIEQKLHQLDVLTKSVISCCHKILSSKYPNSEMILYGSRARNSANIESDIDLLILLPEEVKAEMRIDIHDMLYDIALSEDVVISVIVKSVSKWNQPISQATPLYKSIQQEGIKVA